MHSKVFNSQKGKHVWPDRTICEVHREIYDLLVLEKYDEIIPKLEEAFGMGVSLCKKLVDYKLALPEWKKNTKEVARLRKLRIQLENSHSLRP